MKKINFLLFLLLLSTTAWGANYTGIQLTFNRAGNDAASVTVNVSDQNGNALLNVTATLVSTSFGNLMTGAEQALSNGSVLAPANNSSYANINSTANAEISYLFCINGLDPSFSYNKADIDVYAMNSSGNAQGNGGSTQRYFQFSVSTGNTSNVSLFAEKTEDTDICTVPDQNGGLYHSVQTMTAASPQTATTPLYVRVTLRKTSEQGCYAGIGSVKLSYALSPNKFYTIHRFGTNNAYMYDLGDRIGTSTLDTKKKCWWILIPTANPDCYYIMNATSGKYIQSPKGLAQNVPVAMGSTPVEFQIKKDEKNGSTKGYYYIASTDQTISTESSSSTLGLNWSSDKSCVVAWYIRSGINGNSYWEIVEDENRYELPAESSSFTRSAQIYSIPCGNKGSAYLKNANFQGGGVLSKLSFSASAAPANHHLLYTQQKADVKQGGTLPVSITIQGGTANTRAFIHTDWNKDGEFETSQEITGGAVTLTVPTSAEMGQYRVRIRVIEANLADAEAQATGFSYDFFVNVVSSDAEIEWSVEANNKTRGTASGSVENETLTAVAKPMGDAVFVGWKQMHGYFTGNIIGINESISIPLTESIHLIALFEPNTKEIVAETVSEAAYSTMYYSDKALQIPAEVIAKTYRVVNGQLEVSRTYSYENGDVIPAGEPVVLFDNRKTTNTYYFSVSSTTQQPDPNNMLCGFDEAQTTVGPNPSENYKFYKFSFKGRDSEGKPDNVGFYYGAPGGGAFTSAAHKAYLAVPMSAMGTGSAKEFLSMPQDNEVTGIQDVQTRVGDGAVYTLQGIKVMDANEFDGNRTRLPKGIYIINHKKEIIK